MVDYQQESDELDKKLHDYYNSLDEIPESSIFHYTSYKGLIGILSSRCLWLTGHKYLNDPSEIAHGKTIILDYIKKYLNKNPLGDYLLKLIEHIINNCYHAYITSFCGNDDYLPAWRYYGGNGAGYSIGFKKNLFEISERKVDPSEALQVFKILYEKNKFSEIIEHIFKTAEDIVPRWVNEQDIKKLRHFFRILISYLISILPLVKNSDYQDEKEWRQCMIRIFYDNEWFPAPLPPRLIFKKIDNKDLDPFLNCFHTAIPRLKSLNFDYSDIETITIGPRLDYLSAKLFIEELLLQHGASSVDVNNILIKKSERPFQ